MERSLEGYNDAPFLDSRSVGPHKQCGLNGVFHRLAPSVHDKVSGDPFWRQAVEGCLEAERSDCLVFAVGVAIHQGREVGQHYLGQVGVIFTESAGCDLRSHVDEVPRLVPFVPVHGGQVATRALGRIEGHRQGIEQAMPRLFQQDVRSGKACSDTFFQWAVEIFQDLGGVRVDHGTSSYFPALRRWVRGFFPDEGSLKPRLRPQRLSLPPSEGRLQRFSPKERRRYPPRRSLSPPPQSRARRAFLTHARA